eukprot:Rmarinus@m.29557
MVRRQSPRTSVKRKRSVAGIASSTTSSRKRRRPDSPSNVRRSRRIVNAINPTTSTTIRSSKKPFIQKPKGVVKENAPVDPKKCDVQVKRSGSSSSTISRTTSKDSAVAQTNCCKICENVSGAMMTCKMPNCLETFHRACVNDAISKSERPIVNKGFGVCDECTLDTRQCFLCKEGARIGSQNEWEDEMNLMQCRGQACGKYYHPRCVRRMATGEYTMGGVLLQCSYHRCATCRQLLPVSKAMRCIRCPVAYHAFKNGRCIPRDILPLSADKFICIRHYLAGEPLPLSLQNRIEQQLQIVRRWLGKRTSKHEMPVRDRSGKISICNINICALCEESSGRLLFCDSCPVAYHVECIDRVLPTVERGLLLRRNVGKYADVAPTSDETVSVSSTTTFVDAGSQFSSTSVAPDDAKTLVIGSETLLDPCSIDAHPGSQCHIVTGAPDIFSQAKVTEKGSSGLLSRCWNGRLRTVDDDPQTRKEHVPAPKTGCRNRNGTSPSSLGVCGQPPDGPATSNVSSDSDCVMDNQPVEPFGLSVPTDTGRTKDQTCEMPEDESETMWGSQSQSQIVSPTLNMVGSFADEVLAAASDSSSYYCHNCLRGKRPVLNDVVWAWAGSYKFWPARIADPSEPTCPRRLSERPTEVGKELVQFLGTHDYLWIAVYNILPWSADLDQQSKLGIGNRGGGKNSALSLAFVKGLGEARDLHEKAEERRLALDQRSGDRPPPFVKISRNVYVDVKPFRPPRSKDDDFADTCGCSKQDGACGPESHCLNRLIMVECTDKTCGAGEKCENRVLSKRRFPKTKVLKTRDRGWCLQTREPIKKGQVVGEYIGEVISQPEMKRRMDVCKQLGEKNYYMLTFDLPSGLYIDARHKGSVARFMNHSCAANCETQKWTAQDHFRVGLVARCDLKPGQELTFDYQLEGVDIEDIPCKCGAPNCSKVWGKKAVGPPKEGQKSQEKKKKKKLKCAKVPSPDQYEDKCFDCGGTGVLVLCDRKGCLKAFCLKCIKMDHVPRGGWYCKVHYCDTCGKDSVQFCDTCSNSFCAAHAKGNVKRLRNKGSYCTACQTKRYTRVGSK